jgi:TolB-like protein/Tfp pilus assembly protein PilF
MSLWGEIRRRNVHRVAIAHVAAAWLLIQVVETLFPVFGLSESAVRAVVIVLGIGLVPAVVLSWVFEWTPEGVRRDSDVTSPAPAARTRRFDAAIIAILVLAVAYFAVDKFVFDPVRDTAREAQVAAEARGDAIRQKYGENSIAVLAFEDISEARDLGYFADGIAEELLNLLAKIPELRVAGRTSAFSFKDKPATIPEIGDALGVTYIVEGSVRTAGDRIRITVQLIEAASDTHLFSQNYDRDFGDIFAIQDQVAEQVVDELQISLLGEIPRAKRADPRAYALVVEARAMIRSSDDSEEDYARIQSLLKRALEIDPNYGEALSLSARSGISVFPWQDLDLPEEEQEARLRREFTRVLASDPNNAGVLNWMSWFALIGDNDIETAAAYKKRAHEADPASYEVLWTSLATLPFFGRPDLTAKIGDYLIERDPLCMMCYDNVVDPYVQLGDYASAKARLRDALVLEPGFTSGKRSLGNVHLFAGEPERAMELFSEVHAESGWVLPGHLGALYSLDRKEEFDALLPGFVDLFGEDSPLVVAQVYAWIGDEDAAFRWLDKRHPDDHWSIRSHLGRAWYRKLHDDPRWQALLEQYQMTDEILDSLDLDLRLPPGVEL